MSGPDFAAFQAETLAEGLERVWAPGAVLAEHPQAVLVQGEMHLEVGAETRHLRPGDTFTLPAGLPTPNATARREPADPPDPPAAARRALRNATPSEASARRC